MFKKLLLALTLLLFGSSFLKAQGYFNMGFGLGVQTGGYKTERTVFTTATTTTKEEISVSGIQIPFSYVLRYQFLQKDDQFGLGVAGYPFAGISVDTRTTTPKSLFNNDEEITAGWNVGTPILLEFAYGAGSTEDSEQAFGAFIGAGMEAKFCSSEFYENNDISPLMYGPTLGGGVRFGFTNSYISLRLGYTKPMTKLHTDNLSFMFFYHWY